MSPRARHDKSKARLASYERLLADEDRVKLDRVEIHIPPGPRLGDVVIEADALAKGYGDRLLFEGLSFSLPPAGIVGVIGRTARARRRLFPPDRGRRGARCRHADDAGGRQREAQPFEQKAVAVSPFASASASITTSASRGPGGMWISTGRASRDPRRPAAARTTRGAPFDLSCRARGSCAPTRARGASVRRRADSVFSSTASRACFCSSHDE